MIGIVDEEMLSSIIDLDQRPFGPRFDWNLAGGAAFGGEVGFAGGQAIATRIPILWERVIITPHYTVMNLLDGQIHSVAVVSEEREAVNAAATRIILGSWGRIEAYIGYDGQIITYGKAAGFTVSGVQFLAVPIAMAALVIFTTVLGSIYERMREITIYSSVGLSPLHVTSMFFAESVTHALIGGVIGYLVGVVGIDIMMAVGEIPPGLSLNLSSSAVFLAIGVSFLATMAATIYPAFKVSRLVTPSLERKWRIKTKPMGDEWFIPLPFYANTLEETRGIMVYVKEFMDIHLNPDIGIFWVKEPIMFEEVLESDGRNVILRTIVALPPWDAGFLEQFKLVANKKGDKPFTFGVYLKYLGGERHPWKNRNPTFIDSIRKQLLLWRGLKQEEKDNYIQKGEETYKTKRPLKPKH